MPHIHWVARQNKLEIPNDEEEVNTREIHKCDGQAHDPDTMLAPLTPKPTSTRSASFFEKKIGKEKKQPRRGPVLRDILFPLGFRLFLFSGNTEEVPGTVRCNNDTLQY
jgi:hypothetical protein